MVLKLNVFLFFFRVINCKPANEKSATKPLNMIAMEAESLKLRSEKMYQAELFQGDSGPGSVRIEIKQVKADSEGEMLILAYLGLFPHLWTTYGLGQTMPFYSISLFQSKFFQK